MYNWGTFDRRVWTLRANGENAQLTGDIGSGKSTMVDAITTLLPPAHRISYNKAAGAENRERTLRSYVLGHYKSERNEITGASKPIGLRDAACYTVILGAFTDSTTGSTVTLAQLFWFEDAAHSGPPDRLFVVTEADLSITGHFADFGGDVRELTRRLKRQNTLTEQRGRVAAAHDELLLRSRSLARLGVFTDYTELDWPRWSTGRPRSAWIKSSSNVIRPNWVGSPYRWKSCAGPRPAGRRSATRSFARPVDCRPLWKRRQTPWMKSVRCSPNPPPRSPPRTSRPLPNASPPTTR